MEDECSTPGCDVKSSWLGKPITLQLDHINGIGTDCRLENLRILCPNCHTQTPTWGRKPRSSSGKENGLSSREQEFDSPTGYHE